MKDKVPYKKWNSTLKPQGLFFLPISMLSYIGWQKKTRRGKNERYKDKALYGIVKGWFVDFFSIFDTRVRWILKLKKYAE